MRNKVKRKKMLSLLVSLCMIIGSLPALALTAMAAPSTTGLFGGKYGKAQIFDCQRSPAYPVSGETFRASYFRNIYDDVNGGQFDESIWGDNSDRYVSFYDNDTGDGSVGLNLYNYDGSFVQTVSESGRVWGLGEEGFLYVGGNRDYGYFVSNKEGFAYGDNLVYTPYTGKVTDTAVLSAYDATSTPLGVGETAGTPTVTYTVTFDSQGGSAVTSVTGVSYQSTLTEPVAPTYEGYTFNGWFKDVQGTNAWDFDNDVVKADTTLYADWMAKGNSVLISDSASIEQSNTTRNIAVAPNGKIFVVYQSADGIYVKSSTDNGENFSAPVLVSSTVYEAEIAVSSNGNVYVSWVDRDGVIHISRANASSETLEFTETQSPGNSLDSFSTVHMATDGDYLYIVNRTGQYFYYSTDNGETYSSDAMADVEGGDGEYMFSDVHVNTYTHQIVVQKDDPALTYYISDDYAQSFKRYSDYFEAPDTASDYSVYYSVGSLTSARDGGYLVIAGGDFSEPSPTVKISLKDGKITSPLSTNSSLLPMGRSLSTDSYGNVVAGYTDAKIDGNVCFQVSNDGGDSFGKGIVVAEGYVANAAINPTNGDVMILYQDASGYDNVHFVVYKRLLSGYGLTLNTSSVYFPDSDDAYSVKITNGSDEDMTIEDVKLSQGDNFKIASVTDADNNELGNDIVIKPGDIVYINVEFTPTASGILTDTLSVNYSYQENGSQKTGTRVVTLSSSANFTLIPEAPQGLVASAGNESISLTWDESSGATSYSVYSVSANEEEENVYTLVASDIKDTKYKVGDLTNGTAYSYAVKAVNSPGSSDYSESATATPKDGTTFALTLDAGEGTINSGNVNAYESGKETVLPTDVTLQNAAFGGWYENSDFTGDRVYTVSDGAIGDKTYYALWLYSFDGTVSSDSENSESYNVDAVSLTRNNKKISATNFNNESYFFEGVPKGYYNLVIQTTITVAGVDESVVITKLVYVDGTTNGNIVLPKGLFTSKVTIVGTDTPYVEAGGLDQLSAAIGNTGSETVEVELKVEKNDASANADAVNALITSNGKNKGVMMDVDLTQTITTGATGTTTNIKDLADIENSPKTVAVIIHLPGELQGKNGYAIYRYHDGNVDVLTKTPNANGEYIEISSDRTQITAYLNKFSTYAVVTSDTNTVTLDANGGSLTDNVENTTYGSAVGTLPIPTRRGYGFAGWYTEISGGTQVTADTVETEASDYTLYARWNKKSSSDGSGSSIYTPTEYRVTIASPQNGSISPSGTVDVAKGGSQTFTITPDEGYVIADVLIDGESIGAVSSYTLEDVSKAHTVKVVFKTEEDAKAETKAEDTAQNGLPYYYNKNKNKIFIGFAAEKDGEMSYIAPDDITVLFQENTKEFADISGHWAKDYIDFVTERELFMGTSTEMFSPNAGMTRGMFATVIGRLYERSYGEIIDKATRTFTDCDYNDYYGKYVDWCAKNGIISGVGNALYEPNREISRQEMATVLYNFSNFLQVLPSEIGSELHYADASTISDWAKGAALYCQSTNIISGRDAGTFVPNGTATRAEVAAVMERFIESVIE